MGDDGGIPKSNVTSRSSSSPSSCLASGAICSTSLSQISSRASVCTLHARGVPALWRLRRFVEQVWAARGRGTGSRVEWAAQESTDGIGTCSTGMVVHSFANGCGLLDLAAQVTAMSVSTNVLQVAEETIVAWSMVGQDLF